MSDKKRKKVRDEFSAGGVAVRKHGPDFEVLMIQDHKDKWTFPKGHVEEGEDPAVAAIRETEEETGLSGLSNPRRLSSIRYFFRDKWGGTDRLIRKVVTYYLLTAPPDAEPNPPKDRSKGYEPIAEAAWVKLDEARGLSGYKDNLKILDAAERELQKPSQEKLL